jgi:hypothetical protein
MVKAWTGSGQSLAVRQRAFASVGPRKTPPHTGVKRRGWSRSERSPRERVERHVGFDLVCNGSTLNGSAPLPGLVLLSVFAERFGADADLATVLEAISASCPRQRESHPGRGCRAYYPDLPPTQPPDLPADLRPQRLRLIVGGRSDPS